MHRHVQIVFFGIVTAGVISLTEAHPLIFDHPPIPLAEIGSTPASGYIEPIAATSNTPKLSGRGKESRPKDVSRPNILFLFADDQRNHTLGAQVTRLSSRPISIALRAKAFVLRMRSSPPQPVGSVARASLPVVTNANIFIESHQDL